MMLRLVTLHERSWPETGDPSAFVQWMSTSFVYGDPGKNGFAPPTLSGSVVELPAGVSVMLPDCGGLVKLLPSPPPPPQLASARLASSKPRLLWTNFMFVLQGRTSFRRSVGSTPRSAACCTDFISGCR